MRYLAIALWLFLCSATSAMAQVSIGVGLPGVSIGINLPQYPQLVRVPGYPVYYAPQVASNFFFYDGMYWVYQQDTWYSSAWYNGPWGLVSPAYVPLFVLRIPVRYYRAPPVYFRGWRSDAPPRWGQHWGNEWQQQRNGWDRWQRNAAPAPAPLPNYQRAYTGDRYPRAEQQDALRNQKYRYQPRDAEVRQRFQTPTVQQTPPNGAREPTGGPATPRTQPAQRERENDQRPQAAPQPRSPSIQDPRQQPRPGPDQDTRQRPGPSQEKMPRSQGAQQEPRQGQDRERGRSEERGQDRGRP